MKKVIVSTLLCLAVASSAMAQGRVNFANTSATAVRINNGTIDANNVVVTGGTTAILGTASTAAFGIGPASTRIQLFAGLSSGSLSPVLIGTTTPFGTLTSVTNTSSGIASAQGTFPGGSNLGLAAFDGSSPVFLQFTAESINGLYRGVSPIIQVNLATGAAPATTLFAAAPNASQWNGITMYQIAAVPEPSSMALAGLGAASLLMFRRRK